MSDTPKTCARCNEREPGPGTILCVPCADALAARTLDQMYGKAPAGPE